MERTFFQKIFYRNTPSSCLPSDKRQKNLYWNCNRKRFSTNSRTSLNLATLLVSKQCRGKGYGDVLIKEFLKSAASIPRLKKIHLHFRDSNSQVENFYRRFGFGKHKICGTYSNGERKHYMEIDIKSIRGYLNNSSLCPE